MSIFNETDTPQEDNLVVSFSDILLFAENCEAMTARQIFEMMSQFQTLVGEVVNCNGGRIVKFIGDAVLIVFPENIAQQAVETLRDLKNRLDSWLSTQSLNCRLRVKAHLGPVVYGKLGPKSEKRFDVFGITVNETSRLKGEDFIISKTLEKKLNIL
jgi:adenylate cyclase